MPVLFLVTARAEENEQNPEWKHMYRSWNYMPGEMIEIRCYTNLPNVKLYCNNKELGRKSFDDQLGYIRWVVPYESGEISACGFESECEEQSSLKDSIIATGASCNLQLNLWQAPEDYHIYPHSTDASNDTETVNHTRPCLKQIEVTITDNAGRMVTGDNTLLSVEVSDSGKLVGLENGDLSDCTEYNTSYRRAHEGRLLIYILKETDSEPTSVTVQGDGLRTATLNC